jgi:colanic acid/amylovoran biosynthesis glycosyltransferase
MIVNGFPELSERFIVNQVAGLLEAGDEVDVFSGVEASDSRAHSLVERYRLEERTVRIGIPRSTKARLLGLPALLAGNLARDPVGTAAAFSSRYATASRNLKTLYFLRAFAGRHYPVVHCQFGPNGLIGAFLKDRGFAERLVVTFHGSDINSYPGRHGSGVYRTLYDRADAVTAGTTFTRAKLVANGCPEAKIEVIPVGVRMADYPEAPFGGRSGKTLLSVGRLSEAKGYGYAIRAFAEVRKRIPGAEYLIAGDGPDRPALEGLAADLGLGASVRFLGSQTDTEVAALYRSADVFLLSSIRTDDGTEEGQGLVLQEAQASGLPVIGTRVGGIPEGLLEGKTGFLVPQKDPQAIAVRAIELFENPGLRKSMGESGRAFAAAGYDMPVLTRRLIKIYQSFGLS